MVIKTYALYGLSKVRLSSRLLASENATGILQVLVPCAYNANCPILVSRLDLPLTVTWCVLRPSLYKVTILALSVGVLSR